MVTVKLHVNYLKQHSNNFPPPACFCHPCAVVKSQDIKVKIFKSLIYTALHSREQSSRRQARGLTGQPQYKVFSVRKGH